MSSRWTRVTLSGNVTPSNFHGLSCKQIERARTPKRKIYFWYTRNARTFIYLSVFYKIKKNLYIYICVCVCNRIPNTKRIIIIKISKFMVFVNKTSWPPLLYILLYKYGPSVVYIYIYFYSFVCPLPPPPPPPAPPRQAR